MVQGTTSTAARPAGPRRLAPGGAAVVGAEHPSVAGAERRDDPSGARRGRGCRCCRRTTRAGRPCTVRTRRRRAGRPGTPRRARRAGRSRSTQHRVAADRHAAHVPRREAVAPHRPRGAAVGARREPAGARRQHHPLRGRHPVDVRVDVDRRRPRRRRRRRCAGSRHVHVHVDVAVPLRYRARVGRPAPRRVPVAPSFGVNRNRREELLDHPPQRTDEQTKSRTQTIGEGKTIDMKLLDHGQLRPPSSSTRCQTSDRSTTAHRSGPSASSAPTACPSRSTVLRSRPTSYNPSDVATRIRGMARMLSRLSLMPCRPARRSSRSPVARSRSPTRTRSSSRRSA